MSIPFRNLTRRSLLATAMAAAVFPRTVFGQSDPNNQERTNVKIRLTFEKHTMTATLYDNPSARDFASMLPLDLKIDDFGSNEKIAYLPRKLTVEGHGPFTNERPYDLCYYMPWGNLAMFYADYKHPGLVRLGRFDDGYEALHVRGQFPLRIERIQ
ncbi:MFS transporter [Rhizobium sp. SEMIA 4085]|uniref:Cyclophilin-like peptidyl-prolyl cis-trans isomerase domain-containing protein n=1 Tax=Rhizobium gallicum bv. gallicum R602sp TaxID=1041138 RepID=A0A0B4WZ25_9HYPH|nr:MULTISPECIES: cyclophilin-like fold protein [Rhizobium]AJD40196.1 cyclophilin-like peptidyl-prolyl cis-trans isomerase domain-containing protein [Rhizobium gallicum bv. gallicum R602sp]NNH29789.1 MFS transporter [Rhizobium sp. SEMIA 4085]